MQFSYSKENLRGLQKVLQRLFEILPGLTSWAILIGLTVLSISKPFVAVIIIIAFEFYWILRLLYMTIFLVLSYFLLTVEKETNWIGRIKGMDSFDAYLEKLNYPQERFKLTKRLSSFMHQKRLRILEHSQHLPPPSKDIYHLVIFPIVKEPSEVIEPAIKSLSQQSFPVDHILVIFALEERAPQEIKDSVVNLEKKYKTKFLDLLTIVHLDNVPGEARVKGANATHAARQAAQYFQNKEILFENVIVSCLDADTVVAEEYFSCLTYFFMITPYRTRASFQPIPVYHNNIWDVPAFARVMETGSSFFQLVEATNPEKLVTFSSHSMSFKALVDVGYWPIDMISDDSAIFWKSFIHFDGDYRVVPISVTLSMDVASAKTWWQTTKNIYKQKRRWAWGVENFPIVLRAFLRAKNISLYAKMRHSFKLFAGHISWATWGFILTFIGWLPLIFANNEFGHSVVYYNIPQVTRTIFNLASLSLFISILLSMSLLPQEKSRAHVIKRIGHVFEWVVIPFILVFLSTLPALDAQTRLMLRRYMEFWVTDKGRKK